MSKWMWYGLPRVSASSTSDTVPPPRRSCTTRIPVRGEPGPGADEGRVGEPKATAAQVVNHAHSMEQSVLHVARCAQNAICLMLHCDTDHAVLHGIL